MRFGTHRSLRPHAQRGAGGLFFCLVFYCLVLTGCGPRSGTRPSSPTEDAQTLAPGIVHRALATGSGTGVDIVDVDTTTARAVFQIATENIGRAHGMIGGQAHTPAEWLAKTHALAAVNGGYFGREDAAGRKEFVGLLVRQGRVRHAAPPLVGRGGSYVRAALGITTQGLPEIVWAATWPGHSRTLLRCLAPDQPEGGALWNIDSAVGCGPMLIYSGRVRVTDRQERLASDGALPRTFAAYDAAHRHCVVGIVSGMEYRTLAAWLVHYFAAYDHARPGDAMCLDGGASTQLALRAAGQTLSPRATGVSVPDAVVIVPRPPRGGAQTENP